MDSKPEAKARFTYIRTADTVQCPHCDYVRPIKNISSVHEHIKAKHSGSFKHKCKHCPYESAVKQNLDSHILSRHPEYSEKKQKEFVCPADCPYAANTRGQLRSHYLLKHLTSEVNSVLGTTQNGQIICTCCGADFKSKPAFVYHVVNCLSPDILADEEVRQGLGLSEPAVQEPVHTEPLPLVAEEVAEAVS
jgi:hypothetical protein